MTGPQIRLFVVGCLLLSGVFVAVICHRNAIIQADHLDYQSFERGFAEHFQSLTGHGPNVHWGGCWLGRVEADVNIATFSFLCPGEGSIDLDVRPVAPDIVDDCPYSIAVADEDDPRAADLADRLCTMLPRHAGRTTCCSREQRKQRREPVSLRHDDSGWLN